MSHRRTLRTRTAIGLALAAALIVPAGCGVVYQSPTVSRAAGAGMDVRTIDLTPETVLLANRSPYSPRSLPREFYSAASARQGAGLGALPDAPDTPEQRPGTLQLRLPPDLQPAPYRIGVGDVVLLATKETGSSIEQLSGLLAAQTKRQGYTVSDDGAISIPDIGAVEIAGLTLQEAQDRIFRFLLDNQIDPAFSLEVTGFNSQRVTVGGAVRAAARRSRRVDDAFAAAANARARARCAAGAAAFFQKRCGDAVAVTTARGEVERLRQRLDDERARGEAVGPARSRESICYIVPARNYSAV